MKHRAPKKAKKKPAPLNISPHFKRDGTPKKQYRTQTEARSAAQLAWTLEKVDLDTYRCDHCHLWHIGGRSRDDTAK